MRVKLQVATADDVADLVSLRDAVNRHLVAQHGKGYWSVRLTEKGALFAMRHSTVYIARYRKRPIATLALCTRKPWAIDTKYFSPSKQPLYLTAMEVDPKHQRQGVGKLCLEEACRIAGKWPSDAIRLDAWDSEAGAGEFYRKFGFREVGRATYRNTPLIYFEMLL
jgi:ribosomal protein S18 acetylase RimI-like enzyme